MLLCRAGRGSGPSGDLANVVGIAAPADGAHETWVEVTRLQAGLCGGSRPHFFRGVATVLTPLWFRVPQKCVTLRQHTVSELLLLQERHAAQALGSTSCTSGRHIRHAVASMMSSESSGCAFS